MKLFYIQFSEYFWQPDFKLEILDFFFFFYDNWSSDGKKLGITVAIMVEGLQQHSLLCYIFSSIFRVYITSGIFFFITFFCVL